MSITPKFYAKIVKHKIVFNDIQKRAIDAYCEKWPDEKEVELTVKSKYKPRTSGQPGEDTNFNGYLWGVLYDIIAKEIGEFDLEYVHYWVQIQVGNIKVMKDNTIVPRGTSEMSGGEFAEYCGKVRTWGSIPGNVCMSGLYLPEPYETEFGDK